MKPDQVDATPQLKQYIGELVMQIALAQATVLQLQAENALLRAHPLKEVSREFKTETEGWRRVAQAGPETTGPAGHAQEAERGGPDRAQ